MLPTKGKTIPVLQLTHCYSFRSVTLVLCLPSLVSVSSLCPPYLASLHLSLCFLCFMLIVSCPVCIMFSFTSPFSTVRLWPAMFPRRFLSSLIPSFVYILSVSPSVQFCDIPSCCVSCQYCVSLYYSVCLVSPT